MLGAVTTLDSAEPGLASRPWILRPRSGHAGRGPQSWHPQGVGTGLPWAGREGSSAVAALRLVNASFVCLFSSSLQIYRHNYILLRLIIE